MPNQRRPYFPLPVNFPQQVANEVFPPFVGNVSGEIAINKLGIPLGIARFAGRIVDINIAALQSGRRDTTVFISGEVDVKINGTTCLTTKPRIYGKSGAASEHKTTFTSAADTGVRAAVINQSANTFAEGDILTWDLIYYGETSPATKMQNVCVIVEVEPTT
jgi:hypothetical protein